MLISITWCRDCNHFPAAIKLGMDIKEAFGYDVEYTAGGGGMHPFEVYRDGDIIFSKVNQMGRWPRKGEILSILKGEIPENPNDPLVDGTAADNK